MWAKDTVIIHGRTANQGQGPEVGANFRSTGCIYAHDIDLCNQTGPDLRMSSYAIYRPVICLRLLYDVITD